MRPVPRLGERSTILKELPGAHPTEGWTTYRMSHQMCVPGGWQDIATLQYRARETLAGIYAPDGADIKDIALRASAEMLFSHASTVIVTHPYVRLDRLVTTVDPEQGTEGEPGVAMEICQLLRGSKIL